MKPSKKKMFNFMTLKRERRKTRYKNRSCPKLNRKDKQRLHWLWMRLQNQQNKTAKVETMQVNERENDIIKEDDLQKREKFMGKNEFLSWVEAHDCAKDKLIGYYAI